MELYRLLQDHAHDQKNQGWIEHLSLDWKPVSGCHSVAEVELMGCKSANTHLHLQESLTELYDATGDASVKQSLEEVLEINKCYFYPKNPAYLRLHYNPGLDRGEGN